MDKYIRLTERSGKSICIKDTSTNDNMSIWNAIEHLAELEDMIDDGRLWFTPSNGLRPNPYECAKRWEELWYEVRIQLNELKGKIEKGKLIELPYTVGDTVYIAGKWDLDIYKVVKGVVSEIEYTVNTKGYYHRIYVDHPYIRSKTNPNVVKNRYIFFTNEVSPTEAEAKKKLEQIKKENNNG